MWKILPATSAARISARYAEEAVAASAPAVRFVGALTFSSLVLWCHAPLVNHAVLVVRDLGNGGNVADTEAATKHLATVSQENVHYSPPPHIGKFDEHVVRAYHVFDITVEARCLRDEDVYLNHDVFLGRVGDIGLYHSLVVTTRKISGNCANARS